MIKGHALRGIVYFATVAFLSFLSVGCSGLFYYPDRTLHYPPKNFGYQEEEISFPSIDGTKIYGWFFRSNDPSPKGTIVQFHGNGENMSSHYTSLVWVTKRGYNLFTFDYRGYGLSESEPTHKGTHLDGLAAMAKAWEIHQRLKPPAIFVVYGQSIGGVIAMRSLFDSEVRDSADLIVMDSSFASFRNIAFKIMTSHWLTWPLSPIVWVVFSDKYAAKKAIKRNKVRLLVIHDQSDPVVPFECGEELFKRAMASKDFWKLNEGGHAAIFARPKERNRFIELLDSIHAARKTAEP